MLTLDANCCENKADMCQAESVTCPDGKGKKADNTKTSDLVASCCVDNKKCSTGSAAGGGSGGSGSVAGTVGADIAGSVVLILVAMAVA